MNQFTTTGECLRNVAEGEKACIYSSSGELAEVRLRLRRALV